MHTEACLTVNHRASEPPIRQFLLIFASKYIIGSPDYSKIKQLVTNKFCLCTRYQLSIMVDTSESLI